MSGAKLLVAKTGESDVRLSSEINLSLTSDRTLQKIGKIDRSTSTQSVSHGLTYIPTVLFMRELESSPKKIGHTGSDNSFIETPSSIDDTNINHVIKKHITDMTTSPYTNTDDSASIAIVFIDPFSSNPDLSGFKNRDGARIQVFASSSTEKDPLNKINSLYDTLKVFKSDTVTINIPEWTPNVSDVYDINTTTISHGLNYNPFFMPIIPAQISLVIYYQWYWQWHNRHSWATATEYLVDDYVSVSGDIYICKQYHTSSASTQPGSGASWTDYWYLNASGAPYEIPTSIDLNNLEDIKYVYGGASVFDDEMLEVYCTSSDLVINYKRFAFDWGGSYSTFPARTLTLSYTIFYNDVSEELDLLS